MCLTAVEKYSPFLLLFLFYLVDPCFSKKQFTLYLSAFPGYIFISVVPLRGRTNLDYKEKATGQKTASPTCLACKFRHFRKSFFNSGSQSLKAGCTMLKITICLIFCEGNIIS